ncbi:hypothetical protein N7509_008571 [Penicillium cosmopolitanum]|uniref:Uncharacterized protein n=1 Tax=Penicillium cosmopolitanum TaxID=1131564 RepID=A0A9X0B2T2_9EURO|nr:uncharacterized protein N7509_008571 [Penicillium cosmopolitanum]KAJ5386030.1 hypothetical protein N7509_008571 [Penicillium cosmopolitanum]
MAIPEARRFPKEHAPPTVPRRDLKNDIEAVAKYSNTLTRDCPLKPHYAQTESLMEVSVSPVARLQAQ